MALSDRVLGSPMGSSTILSFRPMHPTYDFGRTYLIRKQKISSLSPTQASGMASKDDTTAAQLEDAASVSNSIFKTYQEGGSDAKTQQVSSLKPFIVNELPYSIVREIKKRVAFSFKEEEEEEKQLGRRRGMEKERPQSQPSTVMGPRCVWPRTRMVVGSKYIGSSSEAEEAQQHEEGEEVVVVVNIQGPRCAWPRRTQAMNSNGGDVGNGEEPERSARMRRVGSEEGGAATAGGGGSFNCMGSRPTGSAGCSQEQGSSSSSSSRSSSYNVVVEAGPRCAWPRAAATTPRRMLATCVGLSLVNSLLDVAQGAAPPPPAAAHAILLQTALQSPPSYSSSRSPACLRP